jgi:hypothetical protein
MTNKTERLLALLDDIKARADKGWMVRPADRMKAELKAILKKDSEARGFTPDEVMLMKGIAGGFSTTSIATAVGTGVPVVGAIVGSFLLHNKDKKAQAQLAELRVMVSSRVGNNN